MTEDWAEIRQLHKSEQMSIKAIVRRTGLARNTVRAALAADEPPKYVPVPAGSLVDGFEPRIRSVSAIDSGRASFGRRDSVRCSIPFPLSQDFTAFANAAAASSA